jgi:hypothetical protein
VEGEPIPKFLRDRSENFSQLSLRQQQLGVGMDNYTRNNGYGLLGGRSGLVDKDEAHNRIPD